MSYHGADVWAGRLFHGNGHSRDRYFIAEQPAPAPHLAHPEGYAALRIVLVTVPRVSRNCEHCPDGFDLHLQQVWINLYISINQLLLGNEIIYTIGFY